MDDCVRAGRFYGMKRVSERPKGRHLHRLLPGRALAGAVLMAASLVSGWPNALLAQEPPNIVVIFCDDLGYGDLGCYGHPSIRTPELDRMAREGMRFTQFYSAAPVCTPSRAALLTGRLPIRNGMCSEHRRVLFPDSNGGLPASEITVAEMLKSRGYATACVGKWHLGHRPEFLPTTQGFDFYFGLPYSNDMDRVATAPNGRASFDSPKSEYWNVPLMRGTEIIERPADQTTLTRRYTDESIEFIRAHREQPFFLYLAHSMPHVPLFVSEEFEGQSRRGLYGDVIEELDANVGRLLETLRQEGLAERTLVIFTSDNGPWLTYDQMGGSAGLLRGGKGSTWEGGMREPAIAWWPSKIAAGSVAMDLACTTDLMATAQSLSGSELPSDRELDSYDLTPVLLGTGVSKRETMFFYRDNHLMAVRFQNWKLHLATQEGYGQAQRAEHPEGMLFHLEHDPSEKHNLSAAHPEVVQRLKQLMDDHRASFTPAASMLE